MYVMPGGMGVTGKTGSKPRLHVRAQDWGRFPHATDFWFDPADVDQVTASTPSILVDNGWTSNGTISIVNGSAADFLGGSAASPDRGTIRHLLCDASGERLLSPVCFGGPEAAYFIKDQFGWTPSALVADFWAIWTTASNADTTGGIGFVEDGGGIQTANDHLAVITSDATNFVLRSGAETSDASSAVDTNVARWRIALNFPSGYVSYYKLTTSVQAIDTIALETDEFPCSFGVGSTSSNVLGLGATHIYYL